STLCRPPSSALFPYTTLFRSDKSPRGWVSVYRQVDILLIGWCKLAWQNARRMPKTGAAHWHSLPPKVKICTLDFSTIHYKYKCRSEEHTSELQSQSNLVCRLL